MAYIPDWVGIVILTWVAASLWYNRHDIKNWFGF